MANEHKGHRARVRDRVRKVGLDHFQNYQVLEYLLTFSIPYKDTNVLAHKLINKFGSFAGVLEANEEDLVQVEGLGEVTAHMLANFLNIYHYYEKDKVGKKVTITSPGDAYRFAKQFLNNKLVEELYLICLTPKNIVDSIEKISEGSNTEASANIWAIIEKMTRSKISNIIIAHNHPKGNCQPSAEDDHVTKALLINLTISGCHLIDHIIIGDPDEETDDELESDNSYFVQEDEDKAPQFFSNYYSYSKSGVLDKFKKEIVPLVAFKKKVSQPCARYEVDDD